MERETQLLASGSFMAPTPEFTWKQYFETSSEKGNLHPLFEKAQPSLRPGMTALDLGCGVGHGAIHLLGQGIAVTAVDIHEEALMRLKDRLPAGFSPQLIQSDFRDLDFARDSFDLIVATNALYFVSPADFAAFWPKLTRWIKPGGFFMGQFMGLAMRGPVEKTTIRRPRFRSPGCLKGLRSFIFTTMSGMARRSLARKATRTYITRWRENDIWQEWQG